MRDAYILSAVRTPVGKAFKGTLRATRPDEMAAAVLKAAVERVSGLEAAQVDDVYIGCAMPEAEQGMNVARISVLRAGFPNEVPAMTLNRFCSSGLEAVAYAASRIQLGTAEVTIGGGTETMSLVPMGGHKVSPNPNLAETFPEVYIGMGLTAERVAERFGISREDQDAFALGSHQKAVAAIKDKKSADEIVPMTVPVRRINSKNKIEEKEILFDTDEGPREDTTLEALAKLKPAFKAGGTVTAGNSSQMSDGAAALILASDRMVQELNAQPLAKMIAYATAGVDPDVMGIGPVAAVPKALAMAGLAMADIGLIELNEAFAAQGLAVVRELGMPEDKLNVNGGAIALGHPLGCTGAKLTCSLLHEMHRRQVEYGMVTMCIGGGMGAAGIFQRVE
jgi:acetyl-CoA acyltransferase